MSEEEALSADMKQKFLFFLQTEMEIEAIDKEIESIENEIENLCKAKETLKETCVDSLPARALFCFICYDIIVGLVTTS